jgi:hypothetical protein
VNKFNKVLLGLREKKLRLFHEFFDYVGLRELHKNKSIKSHFSSEFYKFYIEDLNKFYIAPKVPDIELEQYAQEKNYSIGNFRYRSEIKNNISNNYASGKYYLNKSPADENVNCIILHGWRMDNLDIIYNMFNNNFIKEGFNIYYYTSPYHFEREPKESMFNGELMVGSNIERTILSIKQAVSDVRALIYWLRTQNRCKIVLIGVSLGGLISNLVGVVENKMDALISLIYANSLAHSVFFTCPGKYIKQDYKNNNFTYEELKECWRIIEPSNFMPLIPKEKILLMSGVYDKYVHIEDTSALWEAWGEPKRLLYKCGHSGLILKRKTIYKEVISFIKGL